MEEDDKTPHVLRPCANPTLSYCDKRCEELMERIEKMAEQILTFNKENWDKLNEYTHAIFLAEEAKKKQNDKENEEQ